MSLVGNPIGDFCCPGYGSGFELLSTLRVGDLGRLVVSCRVCLGTLARLAFDSANSGSALRINLIALNIK